MMIVIVTFIILKTTRAGDGSASPFNLRRGIGMHREGGGCGVEEGRREGGREGGREREREGGRAHAEMMRCNRSVLRWL